MEKIELFDQKHPKSLKSIVKMINIASCLTGIFLLSGCHQSYYSATMKNQMRHGGENKEVADLLVDLNDFVILNNNLNTLAQDRAVKKDTYLMAQQLEKKFDRLRSDLTLKAVARRVALPEELSDENDKYYQKIFALDDQAFDKGYREAINLKLEALKEKMTQINEDPMDEFTAKISAEYLGHIRDAFKIINALQS